MLGCIARGLNASGCLLHQFTMMTNHMHLIIVPPDAAALAIFAHRMGQRYAQLRNERRGATGKLFEERFGSKPIVDGNQLMATTLYNDVNAHRAGLADDPLSYPWSTAPLHSGSSGLRAIASMWTPSPWYVGLGATIDARTQRYRELMQSYLRLDAPVCNDNSAKPDGDGRQRIERPDRSTAREIQSRYERKPK